MKNTRDTPTATSLPRAPRDEAGERMRKYFIMMAVRASCFILMVAVTPYGWYTWLFALGAIFLPYLAVVVANVSKNAATPSAVAPERQLTRAPTEPVAPPAPTTNVIRVYESRPSETP